MAITRSMLKDRKSKVTDADTPMTGDQAHQAVKEEGQLPHAVKEEDHSPQVVKKENSIYVLEAHVNKPTTFTWALKRIKDIIGRKYEDSTIGYEMMQRERHASIYRDLYIYFRDENFAQEVKDALPEVLKESSRNTIWFTSLEWATERKAQDPFVEIGLADWEKHDYVPGALLNENGELE